MAKWGEGDPRWIVEERPDATNVNNWHWTEKNASQWSKDKLTELLKGLSITGRCGSCKITEIDKIEGEASANNRKAKLIFFYEWTLGMKWKGSVTGSSKTIEGSITIPNLSDENSPEEVEVDVSITTSGSEAESLKEMIRKEGAKLIRDQLARYIKSLKEDFTQGMILPRKDGDKNGHVVQNTKTVPEYIPTSSSSPDIQRLQIGTKLDTKTIKLTETFKCPAVELYNALTLPELVAAFSHGEVKIDAVKGGKFSMFEGNVSGEFIELELNKKINKKWRYKSWPEGHYSIVKMELEDKGDCTELRLVQTGVPASDCERTREGWQHYYWDAIKRTFGFGAFLF